MMNKEFVLATTFVLIMTMTLSGQVPGSFKYQTIVRNSSGEILANQQQNFVMSILQGGTNGNVVCSESFTAVTNNFGLVNLEIGSQEVDAFDTIDWSAGPYFLRVELNGTVMGTSQLLSVPYALYSEKAGNAGPWQTKEENIYYNNGSIGIGNSTPDSSALLDVSSSNKGFLLPRMTSDQIVEISNPANGLLVYCTSNNKLYVFLEEPGYWKEVSYGSGYILPPNHCESNITVDHAAGDVAPVSKTTTYNIVTLIPGEPTKCWIISNLGSDHMAVAMDDDSEASAGWYWQFNTRQGYMHDGIYRIPNTVWVSSLNEDTDWLPANDPCVIELGNGWRVPTQSEWFNIDAAGNWSDWNGHWNSLLKLHAGGFLNYPDAELRNRGVSGSHWSSNQANNTHGYHFDFRNINSGVYSNTKAFGLSIRCIKD